MTRTRVDNTVLIGPAMVHDASAGLWGFAVIRGHTAEPDGAGLSVVVSDSLELLQASRAALIVALEHATWLADALHFDAEVDLAQAAAMRWAKFEVLLAALEAAAEEIAA